MSSGAEPTPGRRPDLTSDIAIDESAERVETRLQAARVVHRDGLPLSRPPLPPSTQGFHKGRTYRPPDANRPITRRRPIFRTRKSHRSHSQRKPRGRIIPHHPREGSSQEYATRARRAVATPAALPFSCHWPMRWFETPGALPYVRMVCKEGGEASIKGRDAGLLAYKPAAVSVRRDAAPLCQSTTRNRRPPAGIGFPATAFCRGFKLARALTGPILPSRNTGRSLQQRCID